MATLGPEMMDGSLNMHAYFVSVLGLKIQCLLTRMICVGEEKKFPAAFMSHIFSKL
jgi:hypothetical protein